jgi:hypothetical protein
MLASNSAQCREIAVKSGPFCAIASFFDAKRRQGGFPNTSRYALDSEGSDGLRARTVLDGNVNVAQPKHNHRHDLLLQVIAKLHDGLRFCEPVPDVSDN